MNSSQLLNESKIYKDLQGEIGIPKFYEFNMIDDLYVLVTEPLGKNLEELLQMNSNKFSLRTSIAIAEQILSRIEYFHSKNYLHRDLKPDNFLLGKGDNSSIIYLIDYGLGKQFMIKNSHIPFKENKKLTGTSRYASINTHLGYEQSRRDDLECFIYCILYFINGTLPWQGINLNNKELKNKKILEIKSSIHIDLLFQNVPEELKSFYKYVRTLDFEDRPDYGYLKQLLSNIFIKNNFQENFHFDWEINNYKNKKSPAFSNLHKSDKKIDSNWQNGKHVGTMNYKFTNRPTNHQSIKFDKFLIDFKNKMPNPITINEGKQFNAEKCDEIDKNDDLQIPSENVDVIKIKQYDYAKNEMHFYKYKSKRGNEYYENISECFGENLSKNLEKSEIILEKNKISFPFSPKSECLPQNDGKFKY